MRKCVRCQTEMIENYGLKIENILAGVGPIKLSKGQGLLSENIGNIKVAVCPTCGEISIYIDDIEKIK